MIKDSYRKLRLSATGVWQWLISIPTTPKFLFDYTCWRPEKLFKLTYQWSIFAHPLHNEIGLIWKSEECPPWENKFSRAGIVRNSPFVRFLYRIVGGGLCLVYSVSNYSRHIWRDCGLCRGNGEEFTTCVGVSMTQSNFWPLSSGSYCACYATVVFKNAKLLSAPYP